MRGRYTGMLWISLDMKYISFPVNSGIPTSTSTATEKNLQLQSKQVGLPGSLQSLSHLSVNAPGYSSLTFCSYYFVFIHKLQYTSHCDIPQIQANTLEQIFKQIIRWISRTINRLDFLWWKWDIGGRKNKPVVGDLANKRSSNLHKSKEQ